MQRAVLESVRDFGKFNVKPGGALCTGDLYYRRRDASAALERRGYIHDIPFGDPRLIFVADHGGTMSLTDKGREALEKGSLL